MRREHWEGTDPIDEFIGQQLHSISDMDIAVPKKTKGKKPLGWWPYQHNKQSRSINISSHEDRLIAAIDKKYKRGASRRERLSDLLEKGYTKTEAASLLGVSRMTVHRDVKKIRRRLKLWEESMIPPISQT